MVSSEGYDANGNQIIAIFILGVTIFFSVQGGLTRGMLTVANVAAAIVSTALVTLMWNLFAPFYISGANQINFGQAIPLFVLLTLILVPNERRNK